MRVWSRLMRLVGPMGIIASLLALIGCVTIQPQPLPSERSKAAWSKIPPAPNEIVKAKEGQPLKYGADELWVFRQIPSVEDRWYFQGDTLIAIDHVIYETL